jgi:TorA maturation chaperone TorD
MKATKPTRGEVALARGVLYRLSAQAFRYPGEGWLDEWDEIARGVGAALEVLASDGSRSEQVHEAFDLAWAAARDLEKLRLEHARMIGPSPRAGATPYGTEWSRAAGEIRQVHELADLGGFYRAFGLELSRSCDERVDHLAVELTFLQFLCLKEAHAVERGLDDLCAATRAGQMKFLGEHVLSWACACCTRLRGLGADTFYGHAATLLEGFLRSERARFALAVGEEEAGEPRPTRMTLEDCCVSCDRASACLGLDVSERPDGEAGS